MAKNILIMGAAGRDFHNFNVLFRGNSKCRVVAFTAAQIPFINERTYPGPLAGELYPDGIPIYDEQELPRLIKDENVTEVFFSYSDVSYETVMHKASMVTALGARFTLLSAEETMLKSSKPVISVTAVRTGCGKSGITRLVARAITDAGLVPVAVRHPMPYGDLISQKTQRFATIGDIEDAKCTIEEREEYEPLVEAGYVVYSGVDYGEILKQAEKEAGVIIWDGGNNDLPFYKPDLAIVVTDPLRAGHELRYWPGEANLRRADVVVINKVGSATEEQVTEVLGNIKSLNPDAEVVRTSSMITVEGALPDSAKSAVVIEDGPTLTHGGMEFGAGTVAARSLGLENVDVRGSAVGSIKETLEKYSHIKNVVPAMGYSTEQVADLEETINNTTADVVLVATPVDLSKIIDIKKPAFRVHYEIGDLDEEGLGTIVKSFLEERGVR